jgi:alpha-ketoglutarate-dependent taurine dioxygenase
MNDLKEETLPLIVHSNGHADLCTWAEGHRELIEARLQQHGAILLRNFEPVTTSGFEQLIRTIAGEPLEYCERSSPRTQVSGNIYTSTDYPARKRILLHNENSYQNSWPLRIFFCCVIPAERGGETPIADCRRVLARISPQTRERFIQKGWMLVRNFNDGPGITWQTVFQTAQQLVVERHCRANGIEVEWKDNGRLRTRAVRSAIVKHPQTGEHVWFNHALFFHVSSLEPGIREALLEEFGESDLPANTFYGDGSPIEPYVLDEIREAYLRETVSFPWQAGDILVMDNMLAAHSRAPYAGVRRLLVGMAQPIERQDT